MHGMQKSSTTLLAFDRWQILGLKSRKLIGEVSAMASSPPTHSSRHRADRKQVFAGY